MKNKTYEKKMEILSAFSLYKKYGESALRDTYPEYIEFILKHKHCSFQVMKKVFN